MQHYWTLFNKKPSLVQLLHGAFILDRRRLDSIHSCTAVTSAYLTGHGLMLDYAAEG